MTDITDAGRRAIDEAAVRYGLSTQAVEVMARAVARGGGTMAQFDVPELGGSGQWMAGGMTMVGDMFNSGLQATVSNLCAELADAMSRERFFNAPAVPSASAWWPPEFGAPSSVGGQNAMRYAYFPNQRRLAVDRGDGGPVIVLDTRDHNIGGFSQQQAGAGDPFQGVSFSSQHGQYSISTLPRVSGESAGDVGGSQPAPEPAPAAPVQAPRPSETPSDEGSGDVLETIERLAKLRDNGVVTDEEFAEKKAELLKRL